nr:VOC family protein [Nonomuraea diastatica]
MITEFRVDDVDRVHQNLTGFVTDFVNEPTTMPWGNRSLLFRDPDGNLVNFFTPSPRRSSRSSNVDAHSRSRGSPEIPGLPVQRAPERTADPEGRLRLCLRIDAGRPIAHGAGASWFASVLRDGRAGRDDRLRPVRAPAGSTAAVRAGMSAGMQHVLGRTGCRRHRLVRSDVEQRF